LARGPFYPNGKGGWEPGLGFGHVTGHTYFTAW